MTKAQYDFVIANGGRIHFSYECQRYEDDRKNATKNVICPNCGKNMEYVSMFRQWACNEYVDGDKIGCGMEGPEDDPDGRLVTELCKKEQP